MRIAIVGAGGHGRVVLDLIRAEGKHTLVGWIDSRRAAGSEHLGLPVLGNVEELPALAGRFDLQAAAVAVGDNFQRARFVEAVTRAAPGLAFPALIHPAASVSKDAEMGPGLLAAAGAVVAAGAKLGQHVLVNTLAGVDHDCVLGDYSSLAPRASLGGGVTLGAFSAVCLGAGVVHQKVIGPHTIVGAGALVLKDLPGYVVAYGSPARVIRPRSAGDGYL